MNNEFGIRNTVEEAFRPPSWRPKGSRYALSWLQGAGAFLATFIVLISLFLIPAEVNAQACSGGRVSCGDFCQAPAATRGTACSGAGDQVGTIDECGVCSNLSCPLGQTFCNSTCTPNAPACPASPNRNYNACTGCGLCSSGFTNCGSTDAYNCQSNTSETCPSPSTYNPCTRTCTVPYVMISPGAAQSGFFNLTGDGTIGGDLLLGSGNAIRVGNAAGPSVLNFGNYGEGGTDFYLTLHAQGTSRSELVFQQGFLNRWALSVREGATNTPDGGDFEIRRGATNWPRVLAIDYNTGAITLDTNVTVGGDLFSNTLYSRGTGADNIWIGDVNDTLNVLGNTTVVGQVRSDSGFCIGTDCRTSWAEIGGAVGGLATSGTTTPGMVPKFTGAATLGNSIISENGSTIKVGGAITATGCFGPVFVGKTGALYTGNFPSTGGFEGYRAGHNICAVDYEATGLTPAAHMCSAGEILNSISCNSAFALWATGFAWVASGAPSLPTQTNDCLGWTYSDSDPIYNGVTWEFDGNGGRGWAQSCTASYPIACCR
ncbi:MAG: hypothetical protein Q7S48_03990 [bacterium]|nr:hypothetical protein [bacterium]